MWDWGGETFWDEGDANDEAGTAHGGAMSAGEMS